MIIATTRSGEVTKEWVAGLEGLLVCGIKVGRSKNILCIVTASKVSVVRRQDTVLLSLLYVLTVPLT